MRTSTSLAVLCTALLFGAAFAAVDCDFKLDFFAVPAGQDGVGGCGSDCAFPTGLTKTSQVAAGNTAGNSLNSVAFSTDSNGRDSLSVYFKPTYWGLNQGAAVDVSNCFSANVPVSRKLMQTSTLVTTNGTVSGCTVEFNGASAASVSADADGVFNHTFSRNSLAAGQNLLQFTCTLAANSVAWNDGTNSGNWPATPKTVTQVVEIGFWDGQSTAEFAFNKMCNTTVLNLTTTDIAPMPVALASNGTIVAGSYITRPLVAIWGKKLFEIDGSESPETLDVSQTDLVQNARQYFIMPGNQVADSMVNTVADKLQEGFYQFNMTVSQLTDNALHTLNNLNGLTQIMQVDDNAVYQQWQSLTSPVTTMTFGVQRTPTYLSAISADKTGALKTGDKVVLTWKFRGIGDVACKHDTVAVTCKSPYTLVVQNVDKTDTAHTFSVTFTDACNQKKVASFSYTQKGITVDSKPDVPANLLSNGSSPSPKPNSALTTRPALAAAGAAAAALLLPVLL